ncbi:phosphate ABC transporter substrate-binding protein PstS [Sporichthya sp.]|uniref:phosphate ABC transporter substrate-binding protein PstS n=1 Tax=Sporichthya sp. TaxID=65475 RepID=UPI0017F9400F|nr:phosphate ABC transporter substrate-binding protein PstS [Sporichthya sp.]MBA3744024.1 phosphate ABC transporter substrate-binding protein PstS [Sporichthya sp.]
MTRARPLALYVLAALTLGLVLAGAPQSANAGTPVPISGAGSSWSANAIDQWRRNVNQFGLRVNFVSTGSSDGRNSFKNNTVDYAVSEIPYGLNDNGVADPPPSRGFAYMPIVAGGTSFMYNLKAAGKRITNLRMSGDLLTKIFTGVISRWDDAAVKAENPGLALPARPIVPVVRSDGSGTSAQFTLWMSKQHPDLWNAYCQKMGRAVPCGQTSNYPAKAPFLSLAGSLGVSGYVSQDKNEGTITYVEESYALNTGFPVVKLLNKAGYYVPPDGRNVAVALLGATINADLTQNLVGVYDNPDKRAYPLSSYSYMIVPTKIEGPINANKGYTLGKFAKYFLCEGQNSALELGYSPLPKNLVQAGLDVVKRIPGIDLADADITKSCDNKTFSVPGGIAKTAPFPPECDKRGGPTQCTTGTGGAAKTPTPPKTGGSTGGTTGGTGGATPGGAAAGGPAPTPLPGTAPNPAGGIPTPGIVPGIVPGTTTAVDPDTGLPLPAANTANTGDVAAVPTAIGGGTGSGFSTVLVFLAGMLFCGLVIGPPLAARRLAAQRDEAP